MSNRRLLYNPRPGYRNPYATYPQVPPYRIDARAPLSAVDQRALDMGTNASVPFVPRAQRDGMQGVGSKPLNMNGEAVQGLLDKASGVPVPSNVPPSGASIATPNGTASVRFDRGGGGLDAGPSAPIMGKDASGKAVQIGVGRVDSNGQPFDIGESRRNLLAAYPEIGVAGSPENKAFIAHVQQYGEQSAHENAAKLMQPFDAAKAGGGSAPTGNSVSYTSTDSKGNPVNHTVAGVAGAGSVQDRSALPATGSSEDVLSKAATDQMQPGLHPGAPKPGAAIAAAARKDAAIAEDNPKPNPTDNLSGLSGWKALIGTVGRSAMPGGNAGNDTAVAAQPDPTGGHADLSRVRSILAQPAGDTVGSDPASPNIPLFVPGATVPPVDTTASVTPSDIENHADGGILATAGDKIADFMDPEDQAWRAGQHGLAQPSQFTAAGPRALELRAGATPKLFTPAAPSPDRTAIASNDDVPNYASGDYPDQDQPVQSTQPTGNMKAAVIAEKNDLAKAGFEDQARAAGTADASGTWSSQPGTPNQPPVMPGNPALPQSSQPAAPHKLTAHDFDNQWPDPAGLRGRMGGVPSVMGTGGGGGAAHNYAKGKLFTPKAIPNYAMGLTNPDDIGHLGASALPPNADMSEYEDHSRQIGGDSDMETDEERRARLERESELSRKTVPNLAAGRMPTPKLFAPAMKREKAAIQAGVGGAKPTDRPVPTVLPGAGPAVVNSGERLTPTPQGVAVLNRNQQKKAKLFVPSRN